MRPRADIIQDPMANELFAWIKARMDRGEPYSPVRLPPRQWDAFSRALLGHARLDNKPLSFVLYGRDIEVVPA